MTGKYTSRLLGKRVVVVGGTSGIGFCVAEACIEHGAIVTVASSRQSSVDKTTSRISTSYPDAVDRISGKTCDLRSSDVEGTIAELFDFASSNGAHQIDHVVDTAGDAIQIKALAEATPEYIAETSQVRWLGSVMLAKVAAKYLNKSADSSFTMTGGVNSYRPSANWYLLAGVGSGKDGLTRGLAVDMKPVRVNLVAPGGVYTELFERSFSGDALERVVKTFGDKTLVGAIGKPEDVAEAYLYCMKDRFFTGQVLKSEGGYLLC